MNRDGSGEGKTTWIIGDIHGMFDALRFLVDHLTNRHLDKFVFVGDFIDHGPSPKEVLDFIMGLGDKAVALMGNHEHLLLDALYDDWHRKEFGSRIWMENGAESTLRSFGFRDFESFEAGIDAKYTDFLKNLKIFHNKTITCGDNKRNFLITHAGVMPTVPLEEQLKLTNYAEFNRYMKENRVWIEDTPIWLRGDFFNADPDLWQDQIIIHGHTPTQLMRMYIPGLGEDDLPSDIYLRTHPETGRLISVNVDTSAAFGNKLTAVGISQDAVDERYNEMRIDVVQLDLKEGYYRSYPFKRNSFKISCETGEMLGGLSRYW